MNTPVSKPVSIAQLHEEILAAGLTIERVVGSGGSSGIADSGHVVHDGTKTAAIEAVVDAHVPFKTASQEVKDPEVGDILTELEKGTATDGQIQEALAKVLRLLRGE